jgi:hypothetical protein
MRKSMRVIGYVSEENDKLYDVETMRRILGTSRSKVQREIKRNKISDFIKYKNQYLYSEKTLFTIMEKLLIDKLTKEI